MKTKFTLAFVFVMLFANTLFSADGQGNKVSFGLDVTPAITWLNIDNPEIESDGSKLKLNGGLNLYFNLGDSYAIATGLRLNTFGGSFKGTKNGIEELMTYKFQEIEVPFGLKLRTGAIGNMRYVAHLGVGAGFEIKPSASRTGATTVAENYKDNVYDYNLLFARALYNLGLGVEYDLKGAVLTGRLNYKGWFTPIYFYKSDISSPTHQLNLAPTGNSYTETIKFQPSAFELAIGVLF